MNTFFASAERATEEALEEAVKVSSLNPVIGGLMKSVSGLVAILNPQRQIISVNDAALEALGIADLESVVGLRPGQAIQCIHANEAPNGCGTTPYCATCGAAIAMACAIEHEKPEERICAATVERNGKRDDCCFKVQAIPVYFDGLRFILLFMQDITDHQAWSELEASFFHDLNNTLSGLMGTSELHLQDLPGNEDARTIRDMLHHLSKDIELHQMLLLANDSTYRPVYERIRLDHLLEQLQFNLNANERLAGKRLDIVPPDPGKVLVTDLSLLRRMLLNMFINAFEGTDPGGTVRFWVEPSKESDAFCVWNRQVIPPEIQPRIFQRHFSTKSGTGRGLGTYSMKLFAETVLGGSITFNSTAADGTVFRLLLPQGKISASDV
ncbi:sensor histidine kinase [Pontiella sulfatireligans]|uniref:Sensor kinase CckA n=1 Tax=Pontiella sulfatireligans TaxID=2750658 RepID=A0A6C2UJ85_9BACT|nr:PAS domain-containing sensor histidine kinase [Pontiella sulfatireligans]VGO20285.1 Sensor kinase CckA [Pontiella sulfatireligans]